MVTGCEMAHNINDDETRMSHIKKRESPALGQYESSHRGLSPLRINGRQGKERGPGQAGWPGPAGRRSKDLAFTFRTPGWSAHVSTGLGLEPRV